VDSLVFETVPATALRLLAVTLAIELSVIAGHEKDVFCVRFLQHAVHGVEFGRLGEMREVAGGDEEFGFQQRGVDFVDSYLERAVTSTLSRLVEANVTVADLDDVEIGIGGLLPGSAQDAGRQYAHGDSPDGAGADPTHILQKSAPVDNVVLHEISFLHVRTVAAEKYSRE
jgi:hypothetical protein